MLQKNDVVDALIVDVNNLGYGIAKVDSEVVFVQGGVTGDRVRLRIIKCARSYAVARIESFSEVSSYRIDPACPYYKSCGGCLYQHISYSYEKSLKEESVRAALRRAGLFGIRVEPLGGSSQLDGYRNKAQYPVSTDENGKLCAGFYAAKSHRVIPGTMKCSILPQQFGGIVSLLCRLCDKEKISAYREESGQGLLRHICIRSGSGGTMVTLVINGDTLPGAETIAQQCMKKYPSIKSFYLNLNRERGNVILGRECRLVAGDAAIYDKMCGLSFKISPLSFYQVNHGTATLLYQKAKELLAPKKSDTLLDLYCGTGTIGLAMAKCVQFLTGAEIIPQAIADAKENAANNGIENASFLCGDSGELLTEMRRTGQRFSAVVVDPPRRGLEACVIEDLASMQPQRICYISCDPNTLARDLCLFAEKGYRTDTVYPYDMFSRTGHVETVTLLTKDK